MLFQHIYSHMIYLPEIKHYSFIIEKALKNLLNEIHFHLLSAASITPKIVHTGMQFPNLSKVMQYRGKYSRASNHHTLSIGQISFCGAFQWISHQRQTKKKFRLLPPQYILRKQRYLSINKTLRATVKCTIWYRTTHSPSANAATERCNGMKGYMMCGSKDVQSISAAVQMQRLSFTFSGH